jgi:hypothetical protein
VTEAEPLEGGVPTAVETVAKSEWEDILCAASIAKPSAYCDPANVVKYVFGYELQNLSSAEK